MSKGNKRTSAQVKEIIEANITVTADGHWLWTGRTVEQNGHRWGYVSYDGRTMTAHRAAFILYTNFDPGPRKSVVRRKDLCTAELCIAPEHHHSPNAVNESDWVQEATAYIQSV